MAQYAYTQHMPITEAEADRFLRAHLTDLDDLVVLETLIDQAITEHDKLGGRGLGRLGAALIVFCALRWKFEHPEVNRDNP